MADRRKAAMGFIFVTLLIDTIGIGIIIPILPNLIKELINGNNSEAARYGGWLMFAYSIMQFLFAPVLGNLSDKYGRRPVLLFSLLGFGIDYLFLALAPSIQWLFVGRIIAGIMGASFTTASAYIADISEPEKRAQNYGMMGMAFGLGFIIGPIIGGQLGGLGSRVPFYVAAGLTLLNCIYGFLILPESLDKAHRRAFSWKRANPVGSLTQLKRYPVISGLVVSLMCIYVAAHAMQSAWTFITKEKFNWDSNMIGISLGVVGIMIAVVQGGLIKVINPALGQKRSIYVGLLLYVIGFLLFAGATFGHYHQPSWLMFAFLAPYCLGGIAGPSLQAIISEQVPPNEQGELQGGLTSLMSVTSIIGPPMMTNLFAWFTGADAPVYFPGAPFLLGAILTLISLFFAMPSLSRHFRNKPGMKAGIKKEEEVVAEPPLS